MELSRQKNVATIVYFPLVDTMNEFVAGLEAVDMTAEIDVWSDGAAPNGHAACTNDPEESASDEGWYYLELTQAEMNQDYISIRIAGTGCVTQRLLINTTNHVVTVLNVTTYVEPAQGAPPATTTLANKIGYLFKAWRNKGDSDGADVQIYNDAGAVVDQKWTTSESGGTVTKTEVVSGP